MALKNSLLLLFCLSLLCSAANAQLLVSINPKQPAAETLQLYLDELAEFELVAFNASALPMQGVVLKLSLPQQLAVVAGEEQRDFLVQRLESLQPGASERIFVTVKMLQKAVENLPLTVHYGTEKYTHAVTTYLNYAESPLQIDATLDKSPVQPEREGVVMLLLHNKSEQQLHNVRAELVAGSAMEVTSTPLSLLALSPDESTEEISFSFKAKPVAAGQQVARLLVSFEDSSGKHLIEKRFAVTVAGNSDVLFPFAVVAIMAGLVAIAFLSRKKKEPKEAFQKVERKIAEEASTG